MRRATIGATAAVAAACLIAMAPAALGGAARRVEDAQYNYTSGLARPGGTSGELTLGFAEFETLAREKTVTLAVADASGRTVLARAAQDVDGDDRLDWTSDFCGSTDAPLPIQGGVPLQVFVMEGSCGAEASVPTTGSIRAVFRSR